MKRLTERGKAVWAWWEATRAGRALARYNAANGSVLCGGMAYAALFSVFAALTIGYTAFVRVLGANTELRDAVLAQIETWVPGLVDTGAGGVLSPSDLELSTAVSWTSIVATLVLLWSATRFMSALRTSVRAMFGRTDDAVNPVIARLRALLGFALLGVGVLVTAVASVAVSAAVPWLLELVSLDEGVSWAVRGVGLVLTVLFDTILVAAVIRFVGGVRPARRDLLTGSLGVGVLAGGLRFLGAEVIGGIATRNALLASFAVVVTLLLLVNLLARVLLLACAWMAEADQDPDRDPDQQSVAPPLSPTLSPAYPAARPRPAREVPSGHTDSRAAGGR
ncbi:YihY/virulence factor BrkB family protein [Promicromonospora iranensis]|uniref:Membrane protein n=1 Tax=Promicromonospora iranensis TaxID=1105144 RepID=A0ABU2CL81_9MICO|nr:YihY/virulence factor BrkB family protein [Promicromonospora iranensis]MDR7382087.1 membrane protein [Promicromonospora iranensis]